MPQPNGKTQIIQQGASCNVRVTDVDDNESILALVMSASYNEDFKVVEAQVLGFYGAISQDSQGYSCSLTIATYVPYAKNTTEAYLDGGTSTIQDHLKTRTQVSTTRKASFFKKMDFVDTNSTSEKVYNSFDTCIITTNGVQINPGSYVNANMQLMCIQRTI